MLNRCHGARDANWSWTCVKTWADECYLNTDGSAVIPYQLCVIQGAETPAAVVPIRYKNGKNCQHNTSVERKGESYSDKLLF